MEVSQYEEIECHSAQSHDEDDQSTGEPVPAGSGMLYAQQMLQETLAMTRGRTDRTARYG